MLLKTLQEYGSAGIDTLDCRALNIAADLISGPLRVICLVGSIHESGMWKGQG